MKKANGEKVFYIINNIVLLLIGLSCLLPLLHILALSLSDSAAVMSGNVSIWPVGWTIESYKLLIKGTPVLNAFKNSLVITVVGTFLSMVFTIMAAYPLSRPYFYGKKFFTLFIVFTMLFTGGMIPTFIVMKSLGLVNTYSGIWLLGLISTYNMLVMRTFFLNIPDDLIAAARIDGCSEWGILFKVVLPLSKPMLATLSLFYGVAKWNTFMQILIYIIDTAKYNLATMVQQMIRSQTLVQELQHIQAEDIVQVTPETIQAAGIFVMVIPMLLVYPWLQKYFVKGVMLGSIKG